MEKPRRGWAIRALAVMLGAVGTLGIVGNAVAIPNLQLDITPGVYDGSSGVESTIATSDHFTLTAYLANTSTAPTGFYYIWAAMLPPVGPTPVPSLGSYSFEGSSIPVAGGMFYGSHDAQSGSAREQVPEPSTLVLIGSGLLLAGFVYTRKS